MFLFQVSRDQTEMMFDYPGLGVGNGVSPRQCVTPTVVNSPGPGGTFSFTSNRSKITPSTSTTSTTSTADFHHQWFPVPSDESYSMIPSIILILPSTVYFRSILHWIKNSNFVREPSKFCNLKLLGQQSWQQLVNDDEIGNISQTLRSDFNAAGLSPSLA